MFRYGLRQNSAHLQIIPVYLRQWLRTPNIGRRADLTQLDPALR